mmetsp:Transcript_67013/g.111367  ORF Transcript_67013/g.111367 Transcript_67013/m.111367 type:complete len:232 (+) Transcript_67013:479-1174(+)
MCSSRSLLSRGRLRCMRCRGGCCAFFVCSVHAAGQSSGRSGTSGLRDPEWLASTRTASIACGMNSAHQCCPTQLLVPRTRRRQAAPSRVGTLTISMTTLGCSSFCAPGESTPLLLQARSPSTASTPLHGKRLSITLMWSFPSMRLDLGSNMVVLIARLFLALAPPSPFSRTVRVSRRHGATAFLPCTFAHSALGTKYRPTRSPLRKAHFQSPNRFVDPFLERHGWQSRHQC